MRNLRLMRERGKTRRSNTTVNESNIKGMSDLDDDDFEPLSPAHIRELERRVRDSRDPIRYMLVSEFSRRFILYYNVSDDVYAMNDPAGGTLFKRLKTAESVKKFLGKGTSIVKFTTKGGKLKRLSPYHGVWDKRRSSKSGKDA